MYSFYLEMDVFSKLCSATKDNPTIENGGLLFAKFKPKKLIVTDVINAGPLSKRNKYEIILNKEELLTQALELTGNARYFVGTWHSHPPNASLQPSLMDLTTMKNIGKNLVNVYPPVFLIVKYVNNKLIFQAYSLNEKLEIIGIYFKNMSNLKISELD
ncbi:Mov34/MPN/PAD-1 family protein [Geobacillus proteiniphilus]|uniref:Mov34/MPN/PAD-1 family protein n=1 Tax=Geobacillus TaxID=129337 RepID=UPI00093D0FD9|nr:Mov34/MPN/PAD-1 family protein [Geobacillus proteiniphilus]